MSREADDLQLCETFYAQKVAGAVTDQEELSIAQYLLEKARNGMVVNDQGTKLAYTNTPDLPTDADFLIEDRGGLDRRQRVRQALPIVAIVAVALTAIALLYGGGGKTVATPTPTVPAQVRPISLATQTLTPRPGLSPTATSTATPTPTPTSTGTPTPIPAKEVEVKPEPVKLDPDAVIPVSLEVAGQYLPIVPTTLRDDAWAYVADPGQISWLAGSYVNVVLGLPYSEANLDLLATSVHVSDTLTLRNNVAGVNIYQVVERGLVSVYEIEALGQRRAGLTLALVGGNDESPDRRLILWAVPVASGKEEASTP